MTTPAIFRMLRLDEVCGLTGQSRTTIWRKVRANKFPKPIMLSARTPRWGEMDVIRYLQVLRADAGLPEFEDAA